LINRIAEKETTQIAFDNLFTETTEQRIQHKSISSSNRKRPETIKVQRFYGSGPKIGADQRP
jgi:hypothetical protein